MRTTYAVDDLLRGTHLLNDDLVPRVPVIDGMYCEDHATYVAAAKDEQGFRDYWAHRGLSAMDALMPTRYPAQHIAFAENPGNTVTCEDMVGLSISEDPASPINVSVKLYGGHRADEKGEVAVGRLQHIAYSVEPHLDMDKVRTQLERHGVEFMTPLLTFTDPNGARLKQMFVACKVPYGPFVEIIQRGTGDDGQPFQGFNADQIDVLYEHYDAYSKRLIRDRLLERRQPIGEPTSRFSRAVSDGPGYTQASAARALLW